MKKVHHLFQNQKAVIGMVHLLPLPGTPMFAGDVQAIYDQALLDAKTLEEGGVHALMIENFGDMPYKKTIEIEQVAALAAVSAVVKQQTDLQIGIDAAFCDYKAAISIAQAVQADFVRLAVFVDTVESFNGIMEPCAGEALAYRKAIGANHVGILADVQVKHAHMLVPSVPIEESAKVAVSCMADGIIVTGTHTGGETPLDSIKRVKAVVDCPVIIGSGVSAKNIKEQLSIADGAIVGSSLKSTSDPASPIDLEKVKSLVENIY
ncbi:photosystem I assembly BtpA [Mesobacillus campisalis]|uniref:Photosystem I assembly BtpA n=1 Tax=Mesobacillus campisalis TaxID=1408103 RepID=A0A0M2SWI3_9BACI|nr:BtpA/SgcQ family protein [Mesobacillus campisalis]KKK38919.1 photosystem I assembly BtpA [Mesobacillus campisalis]